MSLPARILAALIVAGLLVALGFRLGIKVKQAEWDAAKVATQEATDKALTAVAQAIATRDVKHTTITQKVIRETVEKPVYRDCLHDADSLRDINAALSVSADRGELPASDAAR